MMALKLSSDKILFGLIIILIALLMGVLIYSVKSTNEKYHDYKLNAIMSDPYESYGRVTEKAKMGDIFEIEYQFKGKPYGEVIKVKKDLFKKYQPGDKIPITISRNQPSLVTLTSELEAYKMLGSR